MSEIIQSTSYTKILGSRKVCVINMDEKPYEEEFKGEKIVIPANGKREVFMPLWKASKFKSSCAAPPAMDITGELIKGGKVKMIRVVELTEEEREKLGELSPEELAVKQAKANEAKKFACTECGFEAKNAPGLGLHMSSKHPGAVAVE